MTPPMQRIERQVEGCQYNIEVLSESVECIPKARFNSIPISSLPPHAKWVQDGFAAPPPIGTRVRVKINQLGTGTVQGYFIEHGWVGVHVLPDVRPPWHLEANPGKNYYLVFGGEIEPEVRSEVPSGPVCAVTKDHPNQRPGVWWALVKITAKPEATAQEVRDAVCDGLSFEPIARDGVLEDVEFSVSKQFGLHPDEGTDENTVYWP